MNDLRFKDEIQKALSAFNGGNLRDSARKLFKTLGYSSDKQIDLSPNTAASFLAEFDPKHKLNRDHALIAEWRSVDMLFQLTSEELSRAGQMRLGFSGGRVDNTIIESYLFFAIDLAGHTYTRTQLAGITREVNKRFPMPVILIFRHGENLTLAIIGRRLNKPDPSRDVLQKVTLIKDIVFADPQRAHIDILHDLSLSALYEDFNFHNFVGLHNAWEKCLDTSQLNKRFYRDTANWYFWALKHPGLVPPRNVKTEDQRSIFIIRLITRLIFCWFLQEKEGLIPPDLFRRRVVAQWLKDCSDQSGTYYKAVLQNLFFATLNQKIEDRGFRRYNQSGGRNGNRGATKLYRYRDLFGDPDAFVARLNMVPFVNGGLFDCLDRVYRNAENQPNVRLDDFSEEKDNRLCIPNELFFGPEHDVDLSEVYQDKRKKNEKVRPIIEILSRYKFTVEENTPLEQEIALDPELLGKVFENLLASYNEDTRTTARKATGSFYTPREVVSYMVDEALIAYFLGRLGDGKDQDELETKLWQVFDVSPNKFLNPLSPEEMDALIAAIDHIKILDPACGSSAFPMGALHRLVDLLTKLDPNNRCWKQKQLERAQRACLLAEQIQDDEKRENALRDVEDQIKDIEYSFNTQHHAPDFVRKLYLIENCIFGVDIQPIACQIAKLRFFITLIVDQKVDRKAENFGVRPLPNLETRIVVADTLIGLPVQIALRNPEINRKEAELKQVRQRHFTARTQETKQKQRAEDRHLRLELANLFEQDGFSKETAHQLAQWDPYDQNAHADFFDPEWMFTITDGFDIVVGNPPYIHAGAIKEQKPKLKQSYGSFFDGNADLFTYFYKRGFDLLAKGGILAFISSNKFMRTGYGANTRSLLAQQAQPIVVIDFGELPVFGAGTDPAIVIVRKPRQKHRDLPFKAVVLKDATEIPVAGQILKQCGTMFLPSQLSRNGWLFEAQNVRDLLSRIEMVGQPLNQITHGRFYRGILTGYNEAFVIDPITRDELLGKESALQKLVKPWLDGNEILRWRANYSHQYLLAILSSVNHQWPWSDTLSEITAERIFAKTYPALHAHLSKFASKLKQRADKGKFWWELRSCSYWDEFDQPKIVFNETSKELHAFVDYDQLCINKTGFIIVSHENEFLLGVLNSTVLDFYYRHTFPSWGDSWKGGRIQFRKERMLKAPIPKASAKQKALVRLIVSYMSWLARDLGNMPVGSEDTPALMMSYFEQLLNGLVYELFFPEEFHAHKLFLFDYAEKAKLPALESLPKAKRAAALQEAFEHIYDLNHPIRSCLFSLRSLPAVRLIEGEREEAASIPRPVIKTDKNQGRCPLRETA